LSNKEGAELATIINPIPVRKKAMYSSARLDFFRIIVDKME
jgi:hypothetical protein